MSQATHNERVSSSQRRVDTTSRQMCVSHLHRLFCAYHYYQQGPSGRHIAIVLHMGQVATLVGCILLPLSYTVLLALAGIGIQQVLGLYIVETGISMVVAAVVTSYIVQKRQSEGNALVSPLWSQETLIVLYSYLGGIATLLGLFTFVVYWLPSHELPPNIVIGSCITCSSGLVVLVMARIYGRSPCFRKRQVGHLQVAAGNPRGARASTLHPGVVDDPFSCHHPHHHLQTVSGSPRLAGGPGHGDTGPVVVYTSGGMPSTQTFMPTLMTMPPRYETLSPAFGAGDEDLPPGYMIVSPMSPPPSYSEACDTPKENAVASMYGGEPPPGYTPRIETILCHQQASSTATDNTAHQTECSVVVTDLSNSSGPAH